MFWDNFYSICKEKNTTPSAVCKAIGLSNATATGWKNGTMPKADILIKIADHLECSIDRLLGIKKPQLTKKQAAAVERIKKLDPETIEQIEKYIEFLIFQQENKSFD